jgi:N-acetyl-alpha-D-muramate 1-phosphate uridylyltransferase
MKPISHILYLMTDYNFSSAMVLAAGLGTRMRPITNHKPKPLVSIGGRTMLDHALDRVAEAGLTEAVVNVHYLADQIEAHVARRRTPRIILSDERGSVLETGGGVKKALPLLGPEPFFVLNSDSLWIEGPRPTLRHMMQAWKPVEMDILLLLAATSSSLGYDGAGDFMMDKSGLLQRRKEREIAPFVYAGVGIFKPDLFADTPDGAFSLNVLFDRAIAHNRLYGHRLDGQWLHVGTPDAIAAAEQRILMSKV